MQNKYNLGILTGNYLNEHTFFYTHIDCSINPKHVSDVYVFKFLKEILRGQEFHWIKEKNFNVNWFIYIRIFLVISKKEKKNFLNN